MELNSHTQVTPTKKTTAFLQYGIAMAARYGGRGVFDVLVKADKISEKTADIFSSLFAGGIAGIISYAIGRSSHNDIKNIFSETVALELQKPVHEVTWKDLKQSKNALVQDAMKGYRSLNWSNLFGLSGFFLGALPIPIPGLRNRDTQEQLKFNDATPIDIGMFTYGVRSAMEVTRTQSVTEVFGSLLDAKFSANGIGQSITAADLGQFYQAYARVHAPTRKFSDIGNIDLWNGAEILFERMANLMENSYRPRANVAEVARGDADEIRVRPQENFQMPVFMDLLGFHMINPEKVRESLAYVEIANSYGIPAVKEVKSAMEKGASLERCMEKYPVTIPGEGLPVITLSHDGEPLNLAQNPIEKRFTDHIQKKMPSVESSIPVPNPIATQLARGTAAEGQVARLQQATDLAANFAQAGRA